MVRNPILLLFSIAAATGTLIVGGAFVFLLLVDAGAQEARTCKNPAGEVRHIESNEGFARSFDRIWDELKIQAIAGATDFHVTLTENEVTSRADELLGNDVPVEELTLCFHDGFAEARANVEVPVLGGLPIVGGLFDSGASAAGTLDFSGEHARLELTELDVEALPGFAENELRDELERQVNEELEAWTLDYGYNITFTEGVAAVNVTP